MLVEPGIWKQHTPILKLIEYGLYKEYILVLSEIIFYLLQESCIHSKPSQTSSSQADEGDNGSNCASFGFQGCLSLRNPGLRWCESSTTETARMKLSPRLRVHEALVPNVLVGLGTVEARKSQLERLWILRPRTARFQRGWQLVRIY